MHCGASPCGRGYGPPEYVCWATARNFFLAPSISAHSVEKMVREANFDSCDYAYMNAATSTFFFMEYTSDTAEGLKYKA